MRVIYELNAPVFKLPEHRPSIEQARRARSMIPRAPRQVVDFAIVPPSQWKIHDRLLNWARSCSDGPRQEVAAGFAMCKSDEWTEREYGMETSVPVDQADASTVNKGVTFLPEKHRLSLVWYYQKRGRAPGRNAADLGFTVERLADVVKDARQMLINRKV